MKSIDKKSKTKKKVNKIQKTIIKNPPKNSSSKLKQIYAQLFNLSNHYVKYNFNYNSIVIESFGILKIVSFREDLLDFENTFAFEIVIAGINKTKFRTLIIDTNVYEDEIGIRQHQNHNNSIKIINDSIKISPTRSRNHYSPHRSPIKINNMFNTNLMTLIGKIVTIQGFGILIQGYLENTNIKNKYQVYVGNEKEFARIEFTTNDVDLIVENNIIIQPDII